MSILQKTGTLFKRALRDFLGEREIHPTNDIPEFTPYEATSSPVPSSAVVKSNHQLHVIPAPKKVSKYDNRTSIAMDKSNISVKNGISKGKTSTAGLVEIKFNLHVFGNATMNGRYRVKIDASHRKVVIEAQDPEGAAYAVSTLIQLTEKRSKKFVWPSVALEDWPSTPDEYRGLMLDVARQYHPIKQLQSVIDLCSLYKLRYLHLHLTDNENFMLPPPTSKYYVDGVNLSEIGKPKYNKHGKRAYTINELKELNLYAFLRGVVLVPELDIPGHSEALIRTSPELLGTFHSDGKTRITSLLNFANETVTNSVVQPMLQHVARLFPYSPYIHVGFDEVDVSRADEDPSFKNAIAKKKHISSDKELLWDFMKLMNDKVKGLNITSWYTPPVLPGVGPIDPNFYQPTRRSIVWESFSQTSTPTPPKDIVVMTWSMQDYRPDHLIRDGYSVINGAWSPLYMVGANGSSVRDILKWQGSQEFGGIPVAGKKTKWVTVPKGTRSWNPRKPQVYGASIVVWEAKVQDEIKGLEGRLAAMSERMWAPNYHDSLHTFGNGMLPLFESRLSLVNGLEQAQETSSYKVASGVSGILYADLEEETHPELSSSISTQIEDTEDSTSHWIAEYSSTDQSSSLNSQIESPPPYILAGGDNRLPYEVIERERRPTDKIAPTQEIGHCGT
ncbi:glycoside hydrolase [Basidiobolus meristosporus CBS 931.73]|uniref:beta-N-acetylhexosaminidase n=1 Tax=Basidiobolus meristosporus CBS 931.73 TaxID=1314790 RepID=A0A1Y1ZBI5_9FUNG|nr:glycoside hydrolase [Basidiobolus meristosporus CBS 931.73]|eukprot:ORY07610.1 glycoside hydrolase [Basidiobolus meristosporus CBS 931.73]